MNTELKPTRVYLKSLGFKELPHFTVMNNVVMDLGRRRMLSIGCLGEPNEMMFVSETDSEDSKKITDLVCLHNWDYDGFLTNGKIESALRLFGIPVQEHKPESEENEADWEHIIYRSANWWHDPSQTATCRDLIAEFKKQGFEITKKR